MATFWKIHLFKQILKFTLVFTHPVEDGITLNEEDIKLNGKAGKLGDVYLNNKLLPDQSGRERNHI
uniref:Uncharacterized protein n=1 Tax=Scophthalmus maximus TaxID=52904 RepID=A0A8D3B780_SCOMX